MSRWKHRPQNLTPTLSDSLARYLAEISPKERNSNRRLDCGALARQRLANRRLASITDTDISDIANAWLKDLAPATVVRRLALVSHLYTVARKTWKYRTLVNPFSS